MLSISVALCTFNGEKYIEKQIVSILNQELPVNEIVISDDKSTDKTLEIIQNLKNKYSRANLNWNIHRNQVQLGVTMNFQQAISMCAGDIVFLSDQDDIWMPNKTKMIVQYFQANPNIGLVFSNAFLIDRDDNIKSKLTLFDACGLQQVKDLWESGLQFEIENVIQRLLGATFGLRREFCKKCLPFSTTLIHNYHDGQLAMHSVTNNCCGMINECLISYRIHDNNVVGLGGGKNWIFNNAPKPNELSNLVEPRPINPFFKIHQTEFLKPRVLFFEKRNTFYASLYGKIVLTLNLHLYIKYYKKWWWRFYFSDMLYGINNPLRLWLIHL